MIGLARLKPRTTEKPIGNEFSYVLVESIMKIPPRPPLEFSDVLVVRPFRVAGDWLSEAKASHYSRR